MSSALSDAQPADAPASLHVYQNEGDVVRSAGLQGFGEQEPGWSFGVLRRFGEDLRDAVFGDHVREPVGAEQDAVAGLDRQPDRVNLYVLLGSQGTGDEVFLRVFSGLGAGQVAAADQFRNERVVLGQRT